VKFSKKPILSAKTVAIIVAHPDDETLWAGGTILSHPFFDGIRNYPADKSL